jgi:PHS family inorganic phosphate transporter-like MFS transporter
LALSSWYVNFTLAIIKACPACQNSPHLSLLTALRKFLANPSHQTILFCIFGFAYHHLSGHALLALYVLAQFFFNFGPNSTTFIVPGECFPTRYRSTSHGFSAASGKIGAIIAQAAIAPLRVRGATAGATGRDASPWLPHVMQIFALFMFLGIFTTLCIPETARITLEVLSGEEEAHTTTPESDNQKDTRDPEQGGKKVRNDG